MKIGRFFVGMFGGLFATFGAAAILLIPLSVVGWIANIVQIFNTPGPLSEASTWTILLALKVFGIVVGPLGAVLGWIGIFA